MCSDYYLCLVFVVVGDGGDGSSSKNYSGAGSGDDDMIVPSPSWSCLRATLFFGSHRQNGKSIDRLLPLQHATVIV